MFPADPALPDGVGENRNKLRGKCLRIISPVSLGLFKRHCRRVVMIIGLSVAVIAFSVALSLSVKSGDQSTKGGTNQTVSAPCTSGWIECGTKCFCFSEDMGNWTLSQSSCMKLEAQLARFDNMEELNFLMRYKVNSAHWIGLQRESTQHSWRWTDNTEYNNLFPIRGEGNYAYLSDRGISSGRDNVHRKWICSKSNS